MNSSETRSFWFQHILCYLGKKHQAFNYLINTKEFAVHWEEYAKQISPCLHGPYNIEEKKKKTEIKVLTNITLYMPVIYTCYIHYNI